MYFHILYIHTYILYICHCPLCGEVEITSQLVSPVKLLYATNLLRRDLWECHLKKFFFKLWPPLPKRIRIRIRIYWPGICANVTLPSMYLHTAPRKKSRKIDRNRHTVHLKTKTTTLFLWPSISVWRLCSHILNIFHQLQQKPQQRQQQQQRCWHCGPSMFLNVICAFPLSESLTGHCCF